jgi:hypothetical protein
MIAVGRRGALPRLIFFLHQPLQQREVVLIFVRRKIKGVGHTNEPLLLDRLFITFHETLINEPWNSGRLNRVTFYSHRDLMCMQMQIVQALTRGPAATGCPAV